MKYGSNSMLAARVSFINLIARVCERFPGTDVEEVARGIGMDRRIGSHFLQAGPGFGGSCLGKDVRAFANALRDSGVEASILADILEINETQPEHVVQLVERAVNSLQGKEIAVLGLAFKAGTDDIRESRSISLIQSLMERGAKVRTYDPLAMPASKAILQSRVVYSSSTKACLEGADIAIIMTAWPQFKSLKAADYIRLMRSPTVVDARRIYDSRKFASRLKYFAVGLGA